MQLSQWLKRPEVSFRNLPTEWVSKYPAEIWENLEIDLKYEGYIRRQEEMIIRARRAEEKKLPDSMNYGEIDGLRAEAVQKLTKIQPLTLGQAGRISGITPADLTLITIWLQRFDTKTTV